MSLDAEKQGQILLAAVNQLKQEGRYDDALALLSQLCEAGRQAFGERSFQYATMLAKVADIHRLKGDLSAAETVYRQTIEILLGTVGPDHPMVGENYNGLGLVLGSANRLEEAEQFLAQGTANFKKVFGENSAYYALALNNLAELYTNQGRYDQAIATYQQLLDIQRQLPGQPTASYGERLTRLGGLYYELARYQDACEIFQEAVHVALKLFGENHLNYASSLSSLALQYKMLGAWDEAEDLYKQAVKVAIAVVGDDDPYYATYVSNLSNLYRDRGQYREAVPLLQKVASIMKKSLGSSDPRYASSLNNLGILLLEIGQDEEAEVLFRQALEIDRQAYGEGKPQLIEDLMNIVTVLMGTKRYDEAAQYLNLANDTIKSFDPRHPTRARILHVLGEAALRSGNYQQAEVYEVMAEEIWRTATGPDSVLYADALVNLGWVAQVKGRFEDAERVTRRAMGIYRRTVHGAHGGLATALSHLAGIYAATGRQEEAMSNMQELAEVDDRQTGQLFSIGTESQRLSAVSTVQGDLYLFLSLALSVSAAAPKAFDLVLRRKAIGAEALATQRDAILGGRYPHLEPQFRQLKALRMQIAQKTLASPGPEGLETYQKLLSEWTSQKESLEVELARQIPEMDMEQKLRAADRTVVAQAMPQDSALVEFVRFDVYDFKAKPTSGEVYKKPARYLAFILLAGQPDNIQMIDLGDAESIDRRIIGFRASITGGDRSLRPAEPQPAVNTTDGSDLRQMLFDPILPALQGCTRLFLAPDGDLTRLPFDALPMGSGLRLIDNYQFSYLGVGRDILRFGAETSGQPANPLVIADPDFDLGIVGEPIPAGEVAPAGRQSQALDPNKLHFSPLPGTHAEGEYIAARLGVQPWLKGDALEGRLKACLSPRILHIATHGFFLEDQQRDPNQERFGIGLAGGMEQNPFGRLSHALENPLLRSGLALAGANTWLNIKPLPPEAEDAILTAEDVSGLDLLGTELVVLSACETGLGVVQVGEGVFGLRRSFVLAGAHTLVMSLWKVPDQQTQELMEDFYRRIIEGQPRAEALRAAQLAMKARYPEPLYWGAFICQGDPGPLQRKELDHA